MKDPRFARKRFLSPSSELLGIIEVGFDRSLFRAMAGPLGSLTVAAEPEPAPGSVTGPMTEFTVTERIGEEEEEEELPAT